MSDQHPDPYRSADNRTPYDAQGWRGARWGKAGFTWSVALAAVFLVGLGAWVLLVPKGDADPARTDRAASRSKVVPNYVELVGVAGGAVSLCLALGLGLRRGNLSRNSLWPRHLGMISQFRSHPASCV